MVVLGVLRNRRLEKLSCDKTILIWVKCVDNVTRFELSSQEFRHINFVIIPSAICAPHLIQLGDFTLLGATAPFPIPKFGRWKHCPGDFALAYFTREEHHFKFLSQVYCCLDSVKPLLKPSAAPAGSFLVLLHSFSACFLSSSDAFPNTIWLFIASALFFSFCFSPHRCICVLPLGGIPELYSCAHRRSVHRDIAADCHLESSAAQAHAQYHKGIRMPRSPWRVRLSGSPPCFEFPWERDPAHFGTGINFSEVAVASEGKDSRTLLQNEVKRVELLAKRSFLQASHVKIKANHFLIKIIYKMLILRPKSHSNL